MRGLVCFSNRSRILREEVTGALERMLPPRGEVERLSALQQAAQLGCGCGELQLPLRVLCLLSNASSCVGFEGRLQHCCDRRVGDGEARRVECVECSSHRRPITHRIVERRRHGVELGLLCLQLHTETHGLFLRHVDPTRPRLRAARDRLLL